MAHLLANPVCEVEFAGFIATTTQLARAGWDISVHERSFEGETEMLLHYSKACLTMFAHSRRHELRNYAMRSFQHYYENRHELPLFRVHRAVSEYKYRAHADFPFSAWADAAHPHVVEVPEKDMYDHPIFLDRLKPVAEELIVEPQDVMALLDQIKRMQASEQADIRERRRREQPPVAKATILSFG